MNESKFPSGFSDGAEETIRDHFGGGREGLPTDFWEQVKDPKRTSPNAQYVARVRVRPGGAVYTENGARIGSVVEEFRNLRHFVDESGKSWGHITSASNLYRWPDIPHPSWASD